MKEELIEVLKEEMNYTEKDNRCNTCKFHIEEEGFVDRSWDSFCVYNNIGRFQVDKQRGRCSKFESGHD